MRRRTLFKSDSGTFSGNLADAVFYNSKNDSFVTMSPDEITGVIDGYTPIGVVVIPAEHNVYGTGECGVMSLAEMNCNTPDTGSTSYNPIYWGGALTVTSLPTFSGANYIGNDGNLNNGIVQGIVSYPNIPSDQFDTLKGLDGVSNYNALTNTYYAPSPYNADGSRNEAYYTTVYSTDNVLSDFNGVGNTKVLTDLSTAQSDWKTASTITDTSGTGYYPPACCCWRFHTPGTDQGQWYLPTIGELGYVINRILTINATIDKIKSVYSSVVAVAVQTSRGYLSSLEFTIIKSYYLDMDEGYIDTIGKNQHSYGARAFIRL